MADGRFSPIGGVESSSLVPRDAEESRYWVLATIAEAYVGLEEGSLGQQKLEEAFAAAPEDWMKQSTREQVDKLRALLASSPLKKLSDSTRPSS